MKKRRIAIAALLVALLFGGGYLLAMQMYLIGGTQEYAHQGAFAGFEKAHVLRLLRKGDTAGAIASLESGLDIDIISHSYYDPDIARRFSVFPDRANAAARVMSFISAYRDDFPMTQKDPGIRSAIARELKRYPAQKCNPEKGASSTTKRPPN